MGSGNQWRGAEAGAILNFVDFAGGLSYGDDPEWICRASREFLLATDGQYAAGRDWVFYEWKRAQIRDGREQGHGEFAYADVLPDAQAVNCERNLQGDRGEVATDYNSATGQLTASFAPGEGKLFALPEGY